MAQSTQEIEIKLRIASATAGRRLFREAGFTIHKPRVFEANTVYDSADQRIRSAGELLRVREVGRTGVLTFKGRAEAGKHKSREEIETPVELPAKMHDILTRLGYEPVFRYEKYRTEFRLGGGLGVLDETPIGTFLELEGPARWIDRTARLMGFPEADYITASYGRLYLEWCAERRVPPSHMTFTER